LAGVIGAGSAGQRQRRVRIGLAWSDEPQLRVDAVLVCSLEAKERLRSLITAIVAYD
jgi:hypothetical protein